MGKQLSETDVKQANRMLYDAVADRYEEIDGRRSAGLEAWMRGVLAGLRKRCGGVSLLDIGAGAGFVTRCAEGIFDTRIGVDISPLILSANRGAFDAAAAADADRLPFAPESFDAITCFAALHHLYSFEGLAAEAARALRPGGIFYSDHDMDAAFSRRYGAPLAVYRRLNNAAAKYDRAGVPKEIYETTEWHGGGVDTLKICRLLENNGFTARAEYHWYGLNPLCDRIFGERTHARGRAPLARITAVKK